MQRRLEVATSETVKDAYIDMLSEDDPPENAIKRFDYYREVALPPLHEESLGQYLVLLSLYQTCRYQGVNFLRFLMSGERDLDFFCRKRRARERLPALQVYPKGFTPPHLAGLRKKGASNDTVETGALQPEGQG